VYFVCLDSCVLITLYIRLRSGRKLNGFDELKATIGANVTLVVPQVTLLELEKFVNNAERELLSTVARIETLVGNEGQHVKDDLGQSLAEPLETWRKKRAQDMRAVANEIFDWLKTGEQIKFTQEVAHETRCRMIADKFPKPKAQQQQPEDDGEDDKKSKRKQKEDRRDQDCFIIDSLISHIGNDLADKNLLFATEDNGFGTFGKDGTGPLDDTFQAGLPPARIFKDLSKLVKFINENDTVTLPTQDEVEAEKKREIEQEIKFEQEATAQVLKPVVARMEMPIAIGPPGSQPSVNAAGKKQMWMPARRIGGFYHGPYLVEVPDDGDQPFFDTMSGLPPSAPPDVPAPGLQTFDASNLGDEEPKKDPEPPPKTETDGSSEPPKQ
jgi:hypothetical protein